MAFTVKNRQFSPPHVFNAPLKGFPLELGISERGKKLPYVSKKGATFIFTITSAIVDQFS